MHPENSMNASNSKTSPIFFGSTPQQEYTERSNSPHQSNSDLHRAQSISGHDDSWDASLVCIHDSQPPYEATGARAYECFSDCVRKHVLAVHSLRLSSEEQGLSRVKMELDEMLKKERQGYEEVQNRLNEAFLLLRKARGKIARLNATDDGIPMDFDERVASRGARRE
ncbi:unnamed protein product [Agarophyton chilense]